MFNPTPEILPEEELALEAHIHRLQEHQVLEAHIHRLQEHQITAVLLRHVQMFLSAITIHPVMSEREIVEVESLEAKQRRKDSCI
jgi:hypothetical protein